MTQSLFQFVINAVLYVILIVTRWAVGAIQSKYETKKAS